MGGTSLYLLKASMRCLYPKPECTKQRREEAQKEDTNGRKGESQHPPANDVPSIASNVGGSKFLEQETERLTK